MTLEEAVRERHSVRQYLPTPLTEEQIRLLQTKVDELNTKLEVHLQLIVGDQEIFNSRMAHYGKFDGVQNVFALVGKKKSGENVGRAAAEIVLYAQTLGLNTCIVGMTYKKTETFKVEDGEKIFGAIALGYGKTQGVQHPMKTPDKITDDYDGAPEWFKKGVDYVLLAPTALNQCRVKFTLNANQTVSSKLRLGLNSVVDLGITKFFFELGSGYKF